VDNAPRQNDLFASAPHPLVEEMDALMLDDLTPRQALELLYRWKAAL
jgi:DNA mismatch repair protein MutS